MQGMCPQVTGLVRARAHDAADGEEAEKSVAVDTSVSSEDGVL